MKLNLEQVKQKTGFLSRTDLSAYLDATEIGIGVRYEKITRGHMFFLDLLFFHVTMFVRRKPTYWEY